MPPFGKPEQFGPIEVQGRQLRCMICGHSIFWEHEVQFATPLLEVLDLGAWNRSAQCAVCERCGYVHMFIPPSAFKETEDAPDGQVQPGTA